MAVNRVEWNRILLKSWDLGYKLYNIMICFDVRKTVHIHTTIPGNLKIQVWTTRFGTCFIETYYSTSNLMIQWISPTGNSNSPKALFNFICFSFLFSFLVLLEVIYWIRNLWDLENYQRNIKGGMWRNGFHHIWF